MNTETTNGNHRYPTQPLSNYDPAIEARVSAWFDELRPLVWIPILSADNFPGVPVEVRAFASRFEQDLRWPIGKPEDLLQLPDGITGWLMPADEQNTDVACGLWECEVYILGVQDKRTGVKQTYLDERQNDATGQ